MKVATLPIESDGEGIHLVAALGAPIALGLTVNRSDLAPPWTPEDAANAVRLTEQFRRLGSNDLTTNERWLLEQLRDAWYRLEGFENPIVIALTLTPNEADRLARLLLGAMFIATGAEEDWLS